jgi:hypothetical protein
VITYGCETVGCPLAPKIGDRFCKYCISTKVNVSMSEKTTPVPDELLRELARCRLLPVGAHVDGLLSLLPTPPPLDPVEECAKAWEGPVGALMDTRNGRMLAALRRYRELGCPEIPE